MNQTGHFPSYFPHINSRTEAVLLPGQDEVSNSHCFRLREGVRSMVGVHALVPAGSALYKRFTGEVKKKVKLSTILLSIPING